jgi:hypothetical protein
MCSPRRTSAPSSRRNTSTPPCGAVTGIALERRRLTLQVWQWQRRAVHEAAPREILDQRIGVSGSEFMADIGFAAQFDRGRDAGGRQRDRPSQLP